MFKTGELANLIGVERSFLHYYDQMGIVSPDKKENHYREYDENDLIALASSKYYRAMDMKLKNLKFMIQSSDKDSKIEEMHKLKEEMLLKVEYLKDMSDMTDEAIYVYEFSYIKDNIQETMNVPTSYVPLIVNHKINNTLLKSKEVQNLLNFFPFVSYTYYFPKEALVKKEDFSYSIGLNIISKYQKKYNVSLPSESIAIPESHCISFSISKDMTQNGFTYDDFELVREYAKQHQLELSGEAIAFCVFTNYCESHANIKFVVQIITK